MLDTFFPEPHSSHKDHFVLRLGASSSSLLPSPCPHATHSPSVLCPGSRQRGSSRTRCDFFTRQAGARPLAIIENAQPGDMGIQLLPSSSQEHAVQKPQSHDSEHISTKKLRDDPLSLHCAQGTWNYIPDCFLTFPSPYASLSPSNPIVPYSLSLSFWFFMQSLFFIPSCARMGFFLYTKCPLLCSCSKSKWIPGK